MDSQTVPIRVLLADDHPIVRSGIRKILLQAEDIHVVGEACNGEETLGLVTSLLPDVLLLDMEMPVMNGIEVTQWVRKSFPQVRILALSGYEERSYITEILQLGASGYLIKDEAMDTIVDAVRGVARGEVGWLSRRVSAKITAWMRRDDHENQHLTQREMEVLQLVVQGNTNQRIGMDLHISEKTVEKYMESIMRKLHIGSRVEAAVYAIRNNLFKEKK